MSTSPSRFLGNSIFTALVATSLVACTTDEESAPANDPQQEPDQALVDAYRVPETGAPAVDGAFAARMQARGDRAQAYLDAHVVPDFDRALRETSGVSYATLKAEVSAALQLPDPDASKAALERFVTERGPIVDAALARLGTTKEQVGSQIQEAAQAGETPEPPAMQPPHERGICATGFEFEPFPPYFQAGTFSNGTNTSANGSTASVFGPITAMASNIGGWGNGGGFIRADNIPPFGAGVTVVSTQVGFSRLQTEILLYFPAFASSGIGLSLEVHDGGPGGPLLANCRQPLLDHSLPIGYLSDNQPRLVFHQCVFHHGPGTGFLSTRVLVDAYANSAALIWGGFSQAIATGTVQTVRYNTCLD